MNILFFTMSAGEGHNQVANTLQNVILSHSGGHKVKIIDTFNYVNPNLHKIILGGYIRSIKYIPELYGYFYKKTEESDSSLHDFGELINKIFISRKLFKLLQDFEPDVILVKKQNKSELLINGELNFNIYNGVYDIEDSYYHPKFGVEIKNKKIVVEPKTPSDENVSFGYSFLLENIIAVVELDENRVKIEVDNKEWIFNF